jgi:hypothetical protein
MSRDGINADVRAMVEVATPLRVSHAWIAFACQKAGLTRPRWDHERRVWTATTTSTAAEPASLSITCPAGDRTLRVIADGAHEEIVRRFVTAVLTGMFQRARRAGETMRPRS